MSSSEPAVDVDAIQSVLEPEVGPTGADAEADAVAVEPLEGGNANETLSVQWGDRTFVLRRPPAVETAPGLLHDIRREYTILDALEPASVPTPAVVAVCEDVSVLGDPFYVMEALAGDVIDSELPKRFETPANRRAIGIETVDTLATLHEIPTDRIPDVMHDYHGNTAVGLPASDPGRQVAALRDQFEWALDRTATVRGLPVCLEVADWLEANAPDADHRTVVHGDYKPDNLLFAPGTPPRIAGVLDWEMAGVGDPFTDVGWLLSYWTEARDPTPITDEIRRTYANHEYYPILEVFVDEYAAFMREPDFHSREELLDHYESRTGLTYPREHDRFYRALGVFKLAALCEGFFRVFLEDAPNAKDSYPLMELAVPTLGRQAKQIIEGEVPL